MSYIPESGGNWLTVTKPLLMIFETSWWSGGDHQEKRFSDDRKKGNITLKRVEKMMQGPTDLSISSLCMKQILVEDMLKHMKEREVIWDN